MDKYKKLVKDAIQKATTDEGIRKILIRECTEVHNNLVDNLKELYDRLGLDTYALDININLKDNQCEDLIFTIDTNFSDNFSYNMYFTDFIKQVNNICGNPDNLYIKGLNHGLELVLY